MTLEDLLWSSKHKIFTFLNPVSVPKEMPDSRTGYRYVFIHPLNIYGCNISSNLMRWFSSQMSVPSKTIFKRGYRRFRQKVPYIYNTSVFIQL